VNDPPDLLAGQCVDRDRGVVGCGIDDTVLDDGKAFAALQIGERIGPNRHQFAHIILVDLGERAEPVSRIAHTVNQHVAGGVLVILQIIGGLG
jgi:hypothetical protein